MRKNLPKNLHNLKEMLGKNTSYKRKTCGQKCCFYLRGFLLLMPPFLCGHILASFFNAKGFLGFLVCLFLMGLGALVPVCIKKYESLLGEL